MFGRGRNTDYSSRVTEIPDGITEILLRVGGTPPGGEQDGVVAVIREAMRDAKVACAVGREAWAVEALARPLQVRARCDWRYLVSFHLI